MSETYKHEPPPELVKHVTAICGHRGEEWLESLPVVVADLEEHWDVTAQAPFEKGEFNFVAPVRSSHGADAVLKIAPPYERTEIFAEARFLRSRNGAGCVRLLAESRSAHAILLERSMPGDSMDVHFDVDPFACVEPAIRVLKSILHPPPSEAGDVQFLDDWFVRFRRFRESNFPQPYGERALSIYEKLSVQHDRIFYLHGDFHPGNMVTSDRSNFLAIDPRGLVGHLTYDIAVFLNNLLWWQQGKPGLASALRSAVTKFSRSFGISEPEIKEAAYAYMVISSWWNFEEMPEHYNEAEIAMADIWDL